jgi:hypothetical protein
MEEISFSDLYKFFKGDISLAENVVFDSSLTKDELKRFDRYVNSNALLSLDGQKMKSTYLDQLYESRGHGYYTYTEYLRMIYLKDTIEFAPYMDALGKDFPTFMKHVKRLKPIPESLIQRLPDTGSLMPPIWKVVNCGESRLFSKQRKWFHVELDDRVVRFPKVYPESAKLFKFALSTIVADGYYEIREPGPFQRFINIFRQLHFDVQLQICGLSGTKRYDMTFALLWALLPQEKSSSPTVWIEWTEWNQ